MIVKLKINNSLLLLVLLFLSLFLCKSAVSNDLFYEEEALGQIQHVQVSHGKTLCSLDVVEIVAFSLDMPLAIFLTRFAAVIDSFKTNSALQDCGDATHDNLSFLHMEQKG